MNKLIEDSVTEQWGEFKKTIQLIVPKDDNLELFFYLRGKKGAVNLSIKTNWRLSEFKNNHGAIDRICRPPFPYDLGWHSNTPQTDGQIGLKDCFLVDGDCCYYHGSSLQSVDAFNILLEKGTDAVFEYLKKCYIEEFENISHKEVGDE